MKVVITEDIVRNALNESIDEFLIEEGAFDAVRDWSNRWGINKAGNAIKNAIATYMDWRTQGNWNRKYNINAKGKGILVGNYYTKNWFKVQYNRIYEMVYGGHYGNRQYFYAKLNGRNQNFQHDWQSNSYTIYDNYSNLVYRLKLDNYGNPWSLSIENYNGAEIEKANSSYNRTDNSYEFNFRNNNQYKGIMKIYSTEDDTTPEEYISKYCTPNYFDKATQYTLQDGTYKYAVKAYLEEIQKINNNNINAIRADINNRKNINYNYIIGLFTMASFYKWCSRNFKYIKQYNQQQQQQQNGGNNTNNSNNSNNNQSPSTSQNWKFKFDPNLK